MIQFSPEQILQLIIQLPPIAEYSLILGILLLCGIGLPVPEDITLLLAGLLASTGNISLPGALVAGFVGVLAGDTFLFFLGRHFGRHVFLLPVLRRIFTPERIAGAEARVKRNQHFICFIGRFLPGLRAPIFATAGTMGVKATVFFLQDGLAAMVSVPIWVYLGYWFGSNWDEALHHAKQAQWFLLGAVALIIIGYVIYRQRRRKLMALAQAEMASSVSPAIANFEERK
jgi:membrane protein DedA with SNARE-associated domain